MAQERRAVNALVASGGDGAGSSSSDDAVLVHGLNKVFGARGRAPPKVAVVDLSLKIADGECFGFLGEHRFNLFSCMDIDTDIDT